MAVNGTGTGETPSMGGVVRQLEGGAFATLDDRELKAVSAFGMKSFIAGVVVASIVGTTAAVVAFGGGFIVSKLMDRGDYDPKTGKKRKKKGD